MAERLNLPLSNVKGSISIGMAGTAWAPALENIPALTEEGDLASLFSLVWFLLLSFGAKIFKQKCLVSGTKPWGLQHGRREQAALPSWLLEGRGGDRSPQPQGKVISLYTC